MPEKMSDQTLLQMLCGLPRERDLALRHIFLQSGWRETARKILVTNGIAATDAEDVVSESLIIFDRKVRSGQFDPARGSLKNYFLGICVKFNFTARRSQSRIVLPETMPETDDFDPQNPETMLLDAEQTELLRQLLGQLDERCRELLRLYKLSFSMKEIRERLQLPSDGFTRKSAHDCRKKLFRLFEAHPHIKKTFDR